GVYTLEIFPATVPAPELIVLPSQTIESRKIYSIFVVDMLINIKAFVAPSEGMTPAELPNTAEMSKSHEPIFFLAFFLLTIGLLIRLINSIYSLEQIKSK
ncbi:MAG TPA: hypothetical protein VHK86_05485, partial [Nitrososphaera sp.]|nr:hypothetical protein [Nitrososphaera sp.]